MSTSVLTRSGNMSGNLDLILPGVAVQVFSHTFHLFHDGCANDVCALDGTHELLLIRQRG